MNFFADRRRRSWLLAGLWLLSALYAYHYLPRGWIPHDEGLIGQTAERVIGGELPHRDFDDPYTGGLTFLNAAAMKVFGISLMAPRAALFIVFLAWIPALWFVARRVAPEGPALLFTALAVSWSIPAYSVAIPSWYNTFLATFGVAALFRWMETSRPRWLVVAGVCGGLSILFKIVGLYYVAAGLLFLAYHEQRADRVESTSRGSSLFSIALVALLLLFVLMAAATVDAFRFATHLVHWILPIAAVVGILVDEELHAPHGEFLARLRRLLANALPFLAGVAIPVLLFLVPYFLRGGMPQLLDDVLVKPRRRASFASAHPSPLWHLLWGIPVLLVVLVPRSWWRGRRGLPAIAAAIVLLALLVVSRDKVEFQASWRMLVSLLPVLTVAGAVVTAREADEDALLASRRVLLLAAAALGALVQYPFAAKVYYMYSLPVFALAWLSAPARRRDGMQPGSLLLAGYFIAFSVWAIDPGYIWNMGNEFWVDRQRTPLAFRRAGITVSPLMNTLYTQVVGIVHDKAKGPYVFCAPDCPEIAFLSEKKNPTPVLFDFLSDTTGRAARVRQAIESHDINVAVINLHPNFSDPLPQELIPYMNQRFPHWVETQKFLVFWRD